MKEIENSMKSWNSNLIKSCYCDQNTCLTWEEEQQQDRSAAETFHPDKSQTIPDDVIRAERQPTTAETDRNTVRESAGPSARCSARPRMWRN